MSHFVREPAKNSDKGIMSEQFCLAVTEQKNVHFPQLSGSAASFYFPSFLFRVITPRPFNKNTFPPLFGIILFHVLCTVYSVELRAQLIVYEAISDSRQASKGYFFAKICSYSKWDVVQFKAQLYSYITGAYQCCRSGSAWIWNFCLLNMKCRAD